MLGVTSRRFFSFTFRLSCRLNSTKSTIVFPGENSELRGDGAIRRTEPYGSTIEQTYAGVLSFLRRNNTRNLKNVDVAVLVFHLIWRLPIDQALDLDQKVFVKHLCNVV